MGDLEWARKLMTAREGCRRNGMDETEVMRYDRAREVNGRHANGLEEGDKEWSIWACWGWTAAEVMFRLVCAFLC
jgi:hypothetical protein